MFDLLKKKLTGFIGSITGKQEEPPKEEKPVEEKKEETKKPVLPEREEAIDEQIYEEAKREVEKQEEPIILKEGVQEKPHKAESITDSPHRIEAEPLPVIPERRLEEPAPEKSVVKEEPLPARKEERELTPKLGILSKLKALVTNEVTISQQETDSLFQELEIAMLESDVSIETAQFLVNDLRKRIVGKRVAKSEVQQVIKNEVENALVDLMTEIPSHDVLKEINEKQEKPYVILFLGPNGAGKTTTIAKFAKLLEKNSISCVISASDTFRAAAIEQSVHHGANLNVKVVKHIYGADPSAVAFDAISYAKAHDLQVVLIDTAGRQETNQNLLKEMDKINRVVKPDLKLFIGEAIAGNAIIEQVKKFHELVRVDGIILTKLDCDAKGGTALSLAHETKVPVLYVGVGQGYDDLHSFEPEWIVKNVIAK